MSARRRPNGKAAASSGMEQPAPVAAAQRGAIEDAVDRARARVPEARQVRLVMLPPLEIGEDASIDLVAPGPGSPVSGMPQVLLLNPQLGAWQPFVLPAGSRWVLRAGATAQPRIFGVDGRPLA